MKQAPLAWAGSRRGMAIVQVVVVLAILLVGLAIWKTVARLDAIDALVTPFKDTLRGKVYNQLIGLLLFPFAIAGGFAAGCYFVFGKSQRAAAAGAAVPLAAVVGLLLFQVYRTYFMSAAPSGTVVAGANAPSSNSPTSNRAASNRPAGSSGGNVPVVPNRAAPTVPSGLQQTGNQPGASAPAAPVAPPVVAPPKPVIDTKPILDPIRSEYAAKCEALAVKAEEAFKAAAKPRKEVKFLDESIALFAEVKSGAEALEGEMRGMSDVTRAALEKGGLDVGEAMRAAMDFDKEFNEFDRMVACGELSRFAERAGELFGIIKDNRAKVQIDAKGEATSKDREIETQLFHARTPMGFAVKAKDGTLKKVRGEK